MCVVRRTEFLQQGRDGMPERIIARPAHVSGSLWRGVHDARVADQTLQEVARLPRPSKKNDERNGEAKKSCEDDAAAHARRVAAGLQPRAAEQKKPGGFSENERGFEPSTSALARCWPVPALAMLRSCNVRYEHSRAE